MSATFAMRPELLACLAPAPSTRRGYAANLGLHPKENKIIYAAGRTVVIRDLASPGGTFVYRGHRQKVTTAKISPNGYWVCSGDQGGGLKVWSLDNPEHLVKYETQILAGAVSDVCWDPESKRIIAVGDGGSSQHCKAITYDTGNSVGEMIGHTKPVLSAAARPQRPFRVMTCGEDFSALFYKGPPFRRDHTNSAHRNFVQCVRFVGAGDKAVSVGNDKKIVVYEGREGEILTELENAHGGSIYSVCANADGSRIVTGSADKTIKVWDLESLTATETHEIGTRAANMQVAVAWKEDKILALGLNGDLSLFSADGGGATGVLQGHQGPVSSLAMDGTTGTLFSGSGDGTVLAWANHLGTKLSSGATGASLNDAAHGAGISGMVLTAAGLVTAGLDDTLRSFDPESRECTGELALESQPIALASAGRSSDLVAVALETKVHLYRGLDSAGGTHISPGRGEVRSVAVSHDARFVAIGTSRNTIVISEITGGGVEERSVLEGHRGEVTAVAFSPDGTKLAAGDAKNEVRIWSTDTWSAVIEGRWVYHTTRVLCLAWNDASTKVASGSGDESVIIWNVEAPTKKQSIPYAHSGGVFALAFVDDGTLISGGHDCCICYWQVAA